ncbi:hypothetical protein Pla108_02020 [Botrimarina colliarenosi]|uniref:KAP family P-loop domain protein n=1 Tax=Botrimarina colliarenosi TaxID=2528001 RepID=A0A5C6AIG9_9BACT|nr:hypothetical protein [Botrimarina colliarenosi]TWT99267.1 hypothetical protein Pla108_02020 [Botrimarina colliarenosi]
MRTDQFLSHHGVTRNPFAEEDAQTDQVFKSRCVEVRHPAWDKVYGSPNDPATSLVFGEKGAGKTAMRLQIVEAIDRHNQSAKPEDRVFVVEYDDFNPLLDRFADRLPSRKGRDAEHVLEEWKLWDHMDGVLSIAVTDLVDRLLDKTKLDRRAAKKLDPAQRRDLMLLAACYDDSTAEPQSVRWRKLARVVGYPSWRASGWFQIGALGTAVIFGTIGWFKAWEWLQTPWPYVAVAAAWVPWISKWLSRRTRAWKIANNVRVLRRDRGALTGSLMRVRARDLENQPLPDKRRTDDRYELFGKLQGVLGSLGYGGVMVLVDRVDEPHLLGGKVEAIRDFVWSMLDNKFLRQPGVGFKLLLPAEVLEHLNREGRDFHQRARLDKQNVIPSLDWTAEALSDLSNARLAACTEADAKPATLRELIDPAVSDTRLAEALRSLRTPRHLFKFLFRLISTHCNQHPDSDPVWKVDQQTFEAVLAVYSREQASVDRGLAAS